MKRKLVTTAQMPEDERVEIHALLEVNKIDFYETANSRWGINSACIWLQDGAQYEQAMDLFKKYQAERTQKARFAHQSTNTESWSDLKAIGRLGLEKPGQFLGLILCIAFVFSVTLAPFFFM